MNRESKWDGPDYYGRPQLKAAPFNNFLVGGYIFLAGLSGGAALLAALADRARGEEAVATVRRGRLVALLAPLLGAPLLVTDLHTPKRFYNMLRIAKATSPMSIGTWLFTGFSASAGLSAAATLLSNWLPRWRWPATLARLAQWPTALGGAGLGTYTAALLSATSNPLWAAAPRALAVRFGAASVAAGAAAMSLPERMPRNRRALDRIALAALMTELAASNVAEQRYRAVGVDAALHGGWGAAEQLGGKALGNMLPLGLYAAALVIGRRGTRLSQAASLATLAGGLVLRVAMLGAGDAAALRPDISFRFTQPENLPSVGARNRNIAGD
jgi:protein NrfD